MKIFSDLRKLSASGIAEVLNSSAKVQKGGGKSGGQDLHHRHELLLKRHAGYFYIDALLKTSEGMC